MTKNKKIIFFGIAGLLLIATALFLFKINSRSNNNNNGQAAAEFTPEFLTAQDKKNFGINQNIKAQILLRDANGNIAIYRIINKDSDLVNPNELFK